MSQYSVLPLHAWFRLTRKYSVTNFFIHLCTSPKHFATNLLISCTAKYSARGVTPTDTYATVVGLYTHILLDQYIMVLFIL